MGSRLNLHDRGLVPWVGSVLYRSCTASHNGGLGAVDDLSDLPVEGIHVDDLSVNDASIDYLSVDDLSVDDLSVNHIPGICT